MNYLKTAIFAIVLLAIGYFLLPYVKVDQKDPNISGSNTNENPTPTVKTFTSDSWGVKFDYSADQDVDGNVDTAAVESGDKIYVYYTATPMEEGQWVQKFSKEPNQTLLDAIQKQFLTNYSSKDCYPQTLADYYKSFDVAAPSIPENTEVAVIAYPKPTDPNAPFWQNSEKCPQTYSAANGLSYFWMDKTHPDIFFFFNIGQYVILGDSNGQKTWQDTFVVTR